MNEIKRLREEAGLTQREMAERIGVDIRTYQRWEAKPMIPKKILTVVLAVLAAAGCGSGGGSDKPGFNGKDGAERDTAEKAPEVTASSYLVATEGELPKCESKSKGWLVYVQEASNFRACNGTEWAVVDIKGKDGKDGAAGKDGKDGVAGKDGTDNRMIKSTRCSKVWTMPSAITTSPVLVAWEVNEFSSGDVFTRCTITESGFEFLGADAWAGGSVGSTTGLCSLNYDVDGVNSFGSFTFESGVVSYKSGVETTPQTASYTFDQAADCQSYNF